MLVDRDEFRLRLLGLAQRHEVEVLEGRPARELRARPQPCERGVDGHLICFYDTPNKEAIADPENTGLCEMSYTWVCFVRLG